MDQDTQKLVQIIQQASKIKLKLKKLLVQCDQQKSGFIATQAFMQMLDLHSIKINLQDQQYLKNTYEKRGGFMNYKEVLQTLQINQDVLDPLNSNWLVQKSQDKQSKNYNNYSDQRSQISSRSSHYSTVTIDQNLRDKALQILNKDSYMPNQNKQKQQYEAIPEENDIQLGDDFETYNIRQNKLDQKLPSQQVNKNDADNQMLNTNNFQKPDHVLNKYDKKKYQIAMKADQRIVDLQQKRQEALESIISPLQPKETGKREGKKYNISPEKYNYNDFISHEHNNEQERLMRRHAKEYPDYQSTSILSQINGSRNENEQLMGLRSLEQIHKTKVSADYMNKILNPENISEEKTALIKQLYQDNIDFRTLYQFRDKLFDSPLNKEDKLPIDEYQKVLQLNLGDKLKNVESSLLNQIKVDESNVHLLKLSDLIDLYTYHPVRMKKDKNKSDDLYFVLNSNQRGAHQHLNIQPQPTSIIDDGQIKSVSQLKAQTMQFQQPPLEKKLQNIMDLVGAKLMEKFNSFAAAFRFFDANLNQSISYSEFYNALDHMGIKISTEDSKKIFDYLDTDKNNAVSYNEFCELSEEKRRGIDPFRSNVNLLQADKKQRGMTESIVQQDDLASVKPKNLYLSNINVDDLEQMSKLQSLSSLKKRKYKLQRAVGSYPKSSSSLSYNQLNNTVSYGKKSELQNESIGYVINQNYLKDYLEDKVTRQALIEASIMNYKAKGIHNKSSELRSQSVAKTLKLSEIEKQIEDIKMNKGTRNEVSFIDIQKNHYKLKKELSLPPIKAALSASINGSQTSKQLHMDRLNSNLSSISRNMMLNDRASTTILTSTNNANNLNISPLSKRTDFENLKSAKRIDPSSQQGVLDLIHKMRLQMMEVRDAKAGFTEKPTNLSKREKEEILSNYYNAKKQLNSNSNNL